MKIFMLINVKMPTIVGILSFMSRKNSILCFSEAEKMLNFLIFLYLCAFKISCSAELKYFLLINLKMPTLFGILTFMGRKISILGLSEPEKCLIS